MSSRHTWFWIVLALGLFSFIFFFQRHKPAPVTSASRLLPEMRGQAVSAIQVRPATRPLGIRAERTNGGWQLTQPMVYPAQSTNIDRLVDALENLVPVTVISAAELRGHRNPEEEYGFAAPQASIVVQQGEYRATLLVGAMTTPGDQVFVQVVGREGIYVTDAGWLSCVPKSANEWRDTSVLPGDIDSFDRLAVTNNARVFVLQRDPHRLWRMIWPLNSARADNARIHEALGKLEHLKVRQFVSDDPKADLDSFGLGLPTLDLSLGSGTNFISVLQLGKPVPTATNEVYARRLGSPVVFTVDDRLLAAWRGGSVNDFRDPHLLTSAQTITRIEVHGSENFLLLRETSGIWRMQPPNFPVDSQLVQDFIADLRGLKIVQFTKDVVNPPDLPQFGLATPARRYSISTGADGSSSATTNCPLTELSFGTVTNQPDKVFVWRPDESSVYAVATNDYARLPSHSWQLRERKLWDFTIDEVAGVTIQQAGRSRELIRGAAHQWSFAPGSQGIINDLAVEETVRGIVQSAAVAWVGRGEAARKSYGLAEPVHQVTFHLKNGRKATLQFGTEAPSTNRYAGLEQDGEYWVLEFSWILFRDISSYLAAS